MTSLRIVPLNHADTATLTASSEALPVEQLQASGRTDVWRATGTSATITATFATPKTVDSVALMTSNLSAAATWRVRVFDGATTLYDSGAILSCPPRTLGDLDWGFEPLGVNAFTFGLAPQSVLWIPTRHAATAVQIDLVDTTNPAGYIQASRLIVGERWVPEYTAAYGMQMAFDERGAQGRAEDGSLRSEAGVKLRSLSFSLNCLRDGDRAKFAEITRQLGTKTGFLISIFPGGGDLDREAHYTMLAKFTRAPSIGAPHYNIYASQVEIEEI